MNKEDINKKIYFLDNEYEIDDVYFSNHNNLEELNENNTELYIDTIKEKYQKYFIPENEREYNIKLKININLKNCGFMFAGCKNIIKINFIKFNTKYILNMKYMFYGCINLKNINLFCFNTKNVIDMSYMFKNCNNLQNLDISSFDFINVIDISYIFDDNYKNKYFDIIFRNRCTKLQVLNLGSSNISDLKVLEKVDFKELKKLNLSSNNISDIKVLEKVDFKELRVLNLGGDNLSNNKISDITSPINILIYIK